MYIYSTTWFLRGVCVCGCWAGDGEMAFKLVCSVQKTLAVIKKANK